MDRLNSVMVKVYKCDAEPKQMHEWVNKTIFSTEVLIPKSQGQDSACPWTAFLFFLVFMTLPSTYKFKQALVKVPCPWPLAPSGQGLSWSCLASLWSRTCIALESPPPHTCSNLFNLDLTVQGPQDIFKLVQLGPHCTGNPLDIFKLVHYEAYTVYKWAVGIFLECFLVVFFQIAIRYSQQ